MSRRRVVVAALLLLAALAMRDAAGFGWGAATIAGDRVKWGLRSMGRSPHQPVLVVKDYCRWREGPRGLCALAPGSGWAAGVFRWASPLAWGAAAAYVVAAALVLLRRRGAGPAIAGTGLATLALGVAAIAASRRILVYRDAGVDPGWLGSLTWRAALLLTLVALLVRTEGGPLTARAGPAACG